MIAQAKRGLRRFEKTSFYQITQRTLKIFLDIDAEQRAASFAYYALFSLVPMIALLLSVGSFFFSEELVHQTIEEFVPIGPSQQEILWTMVTELQSARGSVGVISLVLLAWTSLRFFQALVRAVNRAWHTVEIPWWQMPIKNLAMVAVVGGGLVIGILVPAIIQGIVNTLVALEEWLKYYLPAIAFSPDWLALLSLTRYLVSGAVLFYTFTMLYKLAPRRTVTFRQVWVSALLVTVILQAVQVAFVNYLPRIVNYNAVYGSVGGLMLLLLWIYASGIVIIFGACLCAALGRSEDATSTAIPSNSEN